MGQPVFSNPPTPTTSSERSPLLDILRSFALFGILFINMEDFAAPPTAVGRLSLSNYLMQSMVCTTFFYGYGFGWYGKVDPVGQIGLTILLYTIQIPLSNWWLRHFQFGPIGWLWRSLTYGNWQPFRRL